MTKDEMIYYLKQRGSIIGMSACGGNENAKNIIKYYSMAARLPGDPGAWAFLEMEIKKFKGPEGPHNDQSKTLEGCDDKRPDV